jgi:HAMP domain-containing protein
MTDSEQKPGAAKGGKPYKRKLRNYLLDPSFQLKYAGFIFGVAAALSLLLGTLLWFTSQRLVDVSQTAVAEGQHVVELGRKVAAESEKVSKVVEMNIVKDPFYADNPELLEAFKAENADKGAVLVEQQQALEKQAETLKQKSAEIAAQQQVMLWTLFALLALLSVGVGLAGIVVTHRVAGPIFKMVRQIHDVEDGHWNMPSPLRPGDELGHFFKAFEEMVQTMRDQRQHEIDLMDELAEQLGDMGAEPRATYDELHAEMLRALHGPPRVRGAKSS